MFVKSLSSEYFYLSNKKVLFLIKLCGILIFETLKRMIFWIVTRASARNYTVDTMIKSKQYQNLTIIVILNPPLKKVHNRIDATKDLKGEMNREHSLTLWFINWERRIRCRSHSIFTSLPKQKRDPEISWNCSNFTILKLG